MPSRAPTWAENVAPGWQYCSHPSHPFPVSQASKKSSAVSAIEVMGLLLPLSIARSQRCYPADIVSDRSFRRCVALRDETPHTLRRWRPARPAAERTLAGSTLREVRLAARGVPARPLPTPTPSPP